MELLLHEQFSLPSAGPRGVFVIHSSIRAEMSLHKGSGWLEHGKSIPDWLQPTDMNNLWPSASPPGNGGTFWGVLRQALNSSRPKEMLWLISRPARWKNKYLKISCAFLLFPFILFYLSATPLVSRQGSGTENNSLCGSDGWGLLPLHETFMVFRMNLACLLLLK